METKEDQKEKVQVNVGRSHFKNPTVVRGGRRQAATGPESGGLGCLPLRRSVSACTAFLSNGD